MIDSIMQGVEMLLGTPNNFAGEIILYFVCGTVVVGFMMLGSVLMLIPIRAVWSWFN